MSDRMQRKDANEISASILQTTESLFSKYGVENVSMHQIAKTANVGQGTMYRRYTNKGDLCLDLMQDHFHAFKDETIKYLQVSKSKSVKERLQTVFKKQLYFLEKHSHLIEAIHSSTMCENTKKPFYEASPYVFIQTIVRSLLEEAINTEEARPLDADFTAHMLIASMNPKIYLFLRQKKGYTSGEIIEKFNRTSLEPLFN